MKVTLNRQKLGVEDIEWGTGTVEQTRGGETVEIAQVSAASIPYDETQTLGDILTTVITDTSTVTLTNKTIDDITNFVGANHIHYPIRNNSGALIPKGTVVTGQSTQSGTDYIEVVPVIDPQTQIALGITHVALDNNATGLAINTGVCVDMVDTSTWAIGTLLYPNTSGGLTNAKPTSGRFQACAIVTRSHANQGTLLVEFTEPKYIASTTQAGYVQLNNTLTSTSTTEALTAAQGKVLKDSILADPMTTRGDMIVRDASNLTARLGVGTSGQVLSTDGIDIIWTTNPVGVTDHTLLSNIGTNTHAQIDTHIADDTKHRLINDMGTLTTELFSASKIISDLATKSDTTHNHTGIYEPADATILKDVDIGTTVQAYDANLTTWAGITPSTKANIADVLPLTGGTMTGAITALRETKVAMGANDIALASGNVFTKTISGATTLTVSNWLATGNANSFILELTNGGSAAITWFSGVKWASGTAPTLTAAGVDILGFYSHDGGATVRGMVLSKDSK